METITQTSKVLYTAKTHTTGGRMNLKRQNPLPERVLGDCICGPEGDSNLSPHSILNQFLANISGIVLHESLTILPCYRVTANLFKDKKT